MAIIKHSDNKKIIPQSAFETCLISGKTKDQILKEFKGRENGVYYLDKFANNLKDHGISLKEYVCQFLEIDWPKCPVSNEDVGYVIRGNGLIFSSFKRGKVNKEHCEAFRKGCEKLSKDRTGENNPMFGKDSWNKGLSIEDERVRKMAEKTRGRKTSQETKEKQRIVRKNHPLKARHTQKHSEESKNKCREATAKGWANGRFNRKTSIEQKMEDFLKTLPLKEDFVFQFQHGYFTLDFAFPNAKVGIECQGGFFHTDPRLYPNGPKTKIQERNLVRDVEKRKYFSAEKWQTIECWEIEINNDKFKEEIICALRRLNLLQE
jgi:hypothetical protein